MRLVGVARGNSALAAPLSESVLELSQPVVPVFCWVPWQWRSAQPNDRARPRVLRRRDEVLSVLSRKTDSQDLSSGTMELPLKESRKGKYLGFDETTGEPVAVGAYSALGFVEKTGDTMTGLLNNTVGYAVQGTTFINYSSEATTTRAAVSTLCLYM